MEQSLKRCVLKCFFIYLALYFGLFLLFYIPNYVIDDYAYTVGDFEYVRFFFSKLFEFTLGASGVAVLFVLLVRYQDVSIRSAIFGAAAIAGAKIIYSLPYYYLYFLSIGYDSIDGIPLYTLSALLAVIFEFLKILALLAVAYLVSRRHITKELIAGLPVVQRKKPPKKTWAQIKKGADARLRDELRLGGVFNFDAPVTLGIFLISVGQFILALAEEIKNALDYLIEYAGNYRMDEIIYMSFCFIFVLIELLVAHVVCYLLKNKLSSASYSQGE